MSKQPELQYPKVLGEFETLELILQGWSIGRLGDGEANHLRGRKNVSQVAVPALTREIRDFVAAPPKGCLVGIPTIARGPKLENWERYSPVFAQYVGTKAKCGSAFITRPDSAPWIDVPEFYDKVELLWRDQDVTLVANGERSLKADFLRDTGAKHVSWVLCNYRDAYSQIDRIERECVDLGRRVIMCAGPTATVLAARLARRGLHAVDLGHIGMFWRRYANEKIKNRPEQREINRETGKVEPNE